MYVTSNSGGSSWDLFWMRTEEWDKGIYKMGYKSLSSIRGLQLLDLWSWILYKRNCETPFDSKTENRIYHWIHFQKALCVSSKDCSTKVNFIWGQITAKWLEMLSTVFTCTLVHLQSDTSTNFITVRQLFGYFTFESRYN